MQMNFSAAWLFSAGIRPGVLKLNGLGVCLKIKGVRGYGFIVDVPIKSPYWLREKM